MTIRQVARETKIEERHFARSLVKRDVVGFDVLLNELEFAK